MQCSHGPHARRRYIRTPQAHPHVFILKMTAMTTTAPSTVVDPVKKRTWRNSKYPLRLIIRACFLTYMMCGLAYFIQVMPPSKGAEYLDLYSNSFFF